VDNAQWAADVQHRAVVNLDRSKREAMAKAKKAATTTGAPPHCPGIFGSQGSVSSLMSLSPSSLSTFQEGHGCTPLSMFSLLPSYGEYSDGDPHDGFNPNSFFAMR
jgi:hypothetical protein